MTQVNSASTNTNRYDLSFANLKEKQQGAFIPFVTIGDPNAEQSFEVIKTLIDNGADALELGIPFSDPSADGLTIQFAAQRALAANVNTDVCIDIIKKVREYNANIPIGLLLYANLIFARGIEAFYSDMSAAGVDSVLIADVPIRESEKFRAVAIKHKVAPIFIAPPNASNETLEKVSMLSEGYTYVLSRAGVTGTEVVANMPGKKLIDSLNQYNAPAPVLGFGISTPQHVKEAIANGAKGAISGSAVVKIIEKNLDNNQQMLVELANFVRAMKAAT